MFSHREHWKDLSVTLVGENSDHEKREFGPILPGLSRRGEDNVRIGKMFKSMSYGDELIKPRLRRYALRACDQMHRDRGFAATTVWVKMSGEEINPLEQVRIGLPPYTNREVIEGPFTCR